MVHYTHTHTKKTFLFPFTSFLNKYGMVHKKKTTFLFPCTSFLKAFTFCVLIISFTNHSNKKILFSPRNVLKKFDVQVVFD